MLCCLLRVAGERFQMVAPNRRQIQKIRGGGQNVQAALRSFFDRPKSAAPETLEYLPSFFAAETSDHTILYYVLGIT